MNPAVSSEAWARAEEGRRQVVLPAEVAEAPGKTCFFCLFVCFWPQALCLKVLRHHPHILLLLLASSMPRWGRVSPFLLGTPFPRRSRVPTGTRFPSPRSSVCPQSWDSVKEDSCQAALPCPAPLARGKRKENGQLYRGHGMLHSEPLSWVPAFLLPENSVTLGYVLSGVGLHASRGFPCSDP